MGAGWGPIFPCVFMEVLLIVPSLAGASSWELDVGLRAQEAEDSSLAPLQCPGAWRDLCPSFPKELEVIGTWFQPLSCGILRGGEGGRPGGTCAFRWCPPPILPGLFLVFN